MEKNNNTTNVKSETDVTQTGLFGAAEVYVICVWKQPKIRMEQSGGLCMYMFSEVNGKSRRVLIVKMQSDLSP